MTDQAPQGTAHARFFPSVSPNARNPRTCAHAPLRAYLAHVRKHAIFFGQEWKKPGQSVACERDPARSREIVYRRLLLVTLPLQQLALLVLPHLLATLLDHTTQRASPRSNLDRQRDVLWADGPRFFLETRPCGVKPDEPPAAQPPVSAECPLGPRRSAPTGWRRGRTPLPGRIQELD